MLMQKQGTLNIIKLKQASFPQRTIFKQRFNVFLTLIKSSALTGSLPI